MFAMMAAGVLGQQAAAAGPAFDPLSISWDHAFWPEGSDFVALGLSDGAAVATWPDEAGTDDLSQGTAGSRPAYRASTAAFNSKPTVQGDGSDDQIEGVYTSGMATPLTVVVVGNFGATRSGGFVSLFDESSGGGVSVFRANSNAFHRMLAGGAQFDHSQDIDTSPHLFVAVFDGASSALQIDGTQETGTTGSDTMTGLALFANRDNNSATRHNGHVAFAGVIDGDFRTDAKFTDFESWVSSHYGITIA